MLQELLVGSPRRASPDLGQHRGLGCCCCPRHQITGDRGEDKGQLGEIPPGITQSSPKSIFGSLQHSQELSSQLLPGFFQKTNNCWLNWRGFGDLHRIARMCSLPSQPKVSASRPQPPRFLKKSILTEKPSDIVPKKKIKKGSVIFNLPHPKKQRIFEGNYSLEWQSMGMAEFPSRTCSAEPTAPVPKNKSWSDTCGITESHCCECSGVNPAQTPSG